MTTAPPASGLAVTIEFDGVTDSERVEGTVHAPEREPRRFSGWMALLEVLEAFTSTAERASR